MNIIGFSIIPLTEQNGICGIKTDNDFIIFKYDRSNIESHLDKLISANTTIYISDSRLLYRALLNIINPEKLLKLNVFDCKLFLHLYKNHTNIDIYSIGNKHFKIDCQFEINRINR